MLPLYAEVQIDLTSRLDDLLKLGVLDRHFSQLPGQYETLLSDTEAMLIGHPDGLSTEEHQRLRRFTPKLRSMCQQLASYNIPETLHHEDFHDANIYVRNSRYTFSDWGESGVAHPFCTMLVTSRVIAWRLELAENAPEIEYLRDIYLEPWTSFDTTIPNPKKRPLNVSPIGETNCIDSADDSGPPRNIKFAIRI